MEKKLLRWAAILVACLTAVTAEPSPSEAQNHQIKEREAIDENDFFAAANSMFETLAVQEASDRSDHLDGPSPDDDSPEAMLAYFNSPDEVTMSLGSSARMVEKASKIMARSLKLTPRQAYNMLPKLMMPSPQYCPVPPYLRPGGGPGGIKRSDDDNVTISDRSGYEPDIPHGFPVGGFDCKVSKFRTFDGSCNNLLNPHWGKSHTPYYRFLPPDYSDGIQAPRRRRSGKPLPSSRLVSVVINRYGRFEMKPYTHMLMQWGQYMSHDITFKPDARGKRGSKIKCCEVPPRMRHPECYTIPVPYDDPYLSKFNVQCMQFVRSNTAPRKDCALGPREQVNQATHYIDASHIYGVTKKKALQLRAGYGGLLKTAAFTTELLPTIKDKECRGPTCFDAGDSRVNQHPGLMSMHTIWMREHNRLVKGLYELNPHWDDNRLYHEARHIIAAMVQHINYNEYLPIILGPEYMHAFSLILEPYGYFRGYDSYVKPLIANAFTAAAFRFGHSMVQSLFRRFSPEHRDIPIAPPLWVDFFNSTIILKEYGLDQIVLGLLNQHPYYVDDAFTSQLRNHLFQKPGEFHGLDLIALNLQRGRDNGIPSYNEWREFCGLGRVKAYEDLRGLMPDDTIDKLGKLYGHVDDIDLYIAGVSEYPAYGANIGPVFACIIGQQFRNLRYGDRYWYENEGQSGSFSPDQLQEIRKITWSRVICNNVYTVHTIQKFAFQQPSPNNPRVPCADNYIPFLDLLPWKERPPYGK